MPNALKFSVLAAFSFMLVGNPSGVFSEDSARTNTVVPEEREALVALYNATGGSQWTNKSGWLGPPGTECDWYGVTCDFPGRKTGSPKLISIELSNNNLVGAIPPELGRLAHVEWFSVFGNRLTGTLPESLIQRWLAGTLDIAAEAYLLTTVSRIDYESNASSLLCARKRVVLNSDETAVVYTTRCRDATPDDRETYCEVKEGQIASAEFARLAWTIENAGFFTMKTEYFKNITHAAFENTRVVRAGKTVEVSNYATAGPFALWGIQRAIEGIAADLEVQKTTRRATCPEW